MSDWVVRARSFFHFMSSKFYKAEPVEKPKMEIALDGGVASGKQIEDALKGQRQRFQLNEAEGNPGSTHWKEGDRLIAERFLLSQAAGGYTIQLYQAWLLLLEVLDFESFLNEQHMECSSPPSGPSRPSPSVIGIRLPARTPDKEPPALERAQDFLRRRYRQGYPGVFRHAETGFLALPTEVGRGGWPNRQWIF